MPPKSLPNIALLVCVPLLPTVALVASANVRLSRSRRLGSLGRWPLGVGGPQHHLNEFIRYYADDGALDAILRLCAPDTRRIGLKTLPEHSAGEHNRSATQLILPAPVDGIGLQSHFSARVTPMDELFKRLDRYAAFGKELEITEFDIDTFDEVTQADCARDFMTATFSYPSAKAFLIWGFWEGSHWRPRGAMLRRDWSPKPNAEVYKDLVFKRWWTNANGRPARRAHLRRAASWANTKSKPRPAASPRPSA
jgi:hypothetical protein